MLKTAVHLITSKQKCCECFQNYPLKDAGGNVRTARVERSGAAYIKMSLVERLQNTQEVGALQLWRKTDGEGRECMLYMNSSSLFVHF